MKKFFTILAVFFLVMGSNFIFAQESDITSVDESVLFPEGNGPKVAQKVGEGVLTNEDDENESPKGDVKNTSKREFPKEENPFEKYNKSVGVFGYAYPGLSWQHWLGKFGYQINFSGMYLPMENYDYDSNTEEEIINEYIYSFYMLTAEAQFEFFTTRFLKNWYGRLYGVLLGGFYYQSDYNVPELFNGIAGFGLGFETIYYKHFSIPFHFGYYAEFPTNFKLDFMGGIGLRFRF